MAAVQRPGAAQLTSGSQPPAHRKEERGGCWLAAGGWLLSSTLLSAGLASLPVLLLVPRLEAMNSESEFT